jgi:hypothetical protein
LAADSPRVPRIVAALAALSALVVGFVWGARIAGGSDSYCYIEQAERWATGTMLTPQPVGFAPPWAEPWLPLAPTGFVPSRTSAGALAPICPSGLSLTMAAFRLIGGRDAVFLVVPVLGAIAVGVAYLLGAGLAGPAAGALAAVLLASSPIFLFQLVQPMSDVPATAWSLLALWLAVGPIEPTRAVGDDERARKRGGGHGVRAAFAGLATAAAVLTRPVLAPLGVVVFVAVVLRPSVGGLRDRLTRMVLFCAGGLPGAIALAIVQDRLYGSPFSSGYGSPSALFSAAFVAPNLARYARWALETQTPFLLLAPCALWLPDRRRPAALLLVAIACVCASYLPYTVFDDWSYLRFLLPAVALAVVLASAVAVTLAARLPRRWSAATLATLAVALVVWQVHTARARFAFELHKSEATFRIVGEYIGRALPPKAVVLTIWHSGSVRYYGHRLSIVWDGFPPGDFDRTVAFLGQHGFEPYLLLEASEDPRFRARVGAASVFSALDWPPAAMFGREVRLYRLADRQAYFAGANVGTAHLRAR